MQQAIEGKIFFAWESVVNETINLFPPYLSNQYLSVCPSIEHLLTIPPRAPTDGRTNGIHFLFFSIRLSVNRTFANDSAASADGQTNEINFV